MSDDEAEAVLTVLSTEECLRLLAEHPARVGRITAASERPDILPVNYCLDDHGMVVLRTEPGKKLDAAARGRFVAFEVDEMEPEARRGWSVLIRGWAEEVTDAEDIARLRQLPLRSWAPGSRDHFVRIRPEIVSGRRIT